MKETKEVNGHWRNAKKKRKKKRVRKRRKKTPTVRGNENSYPWKKKRWPPTTSDRKPGTKEAEGRREGPNLPLQFDEQARGRLDGQ